MGGAPSAIIGASVMNDGESVVSEGTTRTTSGVARGTGGTELRNLGESSAEGGAIQSIIGEPHRTVGLSQVKGGTRVAEGGVEVRPRGKWVRRAVAKLDPRGADRAFVHAGPYDSGTMQTVPVARRHRRHASRRIKGTRLAPKPRMRSNAHANALMRSAVGALRRANPPIQDAWPAFTGA
jgi:hypothetical protein